MKVLIIITILFGSCHLFSAFKVEHFKSKGPDYRVKYKDWRLVANVLLIATVLLILMVIFTIISPN